MTPDKNNLNENNNGFSYLSDLADLLSFAWDVICLIAEGLGSLF